MNRRDFLKLLGTCAVAGALRPELFAVSPAAGKTKARSVIELWIWGGPCHLEMFDPKPDAGVEYNGGYGDIPTNVPGIRISEFLPKLARQADKYSIIRSMTHGINAHETATYLMQTGRMPGGGLTCPAIGAVIAMMKRNEYKGKLPPYIALTSNKGRFSENGFLSDIYKPLATGSNPNAARFQVDGFVPPGNISRKQFAERLKFARSLDTLGNTQPGHPEFREFDKATDDALAIIQGSDAQAFDLSRESGEMRDRYGRNTFGQCCLAARRLVQAGVPYITINAQGWDTHKKHFESMKRLAPQFDQGVAALLEDLAEKKLLDSTLIWCSGEFGRTPKIDVGEPWNGGRNHYGTCFSAMVAGGGFAGGRVLGESDARGEHPVKRPVHPVDLLWSIYELAGIDPAAKLPNPRGLDLTILPGDGRNRLRELYKNGGVSA